jgi:nucleoside 2-deoxyribosyltransferase
MHKIYLAGPITGCSWGESENWRDKFKAFEIPNVQCYSPLRGKEYLKGDRMIADSYMQHRMSTAKAIMVRDAFDVRSADAVVVNFQGAQRVSIGTVMEIAWAWDRNKPVIAIFDEPGTPDPAVYAPGTAPRDIHEHAMLNEAISWKVYNLEDAAEICRLLFNA